MNTKHDIMIGRLVGDGWHRAEIGNWLIEIATACLSPESSISDRIGKCWHVPIQCSPVEVGRNVLVAEAIKRGVDYLFMCDDDMAVAPGFFETAMRKFLASRAVPCVIGTPACGGPPDEKVCVFEFDQSIEETAVGQATVQYKSVPVSQIRAATATEFERVANLGAGVIGYDMRVFKDIPTPYFANQYNADHTEVVESEECYLHRRLLRAGITLWCAWGFWSDHFKIKRVTRPKE